MRFDEMLDSCSGCDQPEQQSSPDLQAIRTALSSSLEDLRNIAAGIGIPGIADLSLADTARRAIRDFERHAGLKVTAHIEGDVTTIPLATKITLFRLLQESLTNCAKHAQGSTPDVRVCQMPDSITVEVSDHGAGFETGTALRSGRLGLSFMQERVRLLGGTIQIDSAPGHGTRVFAELPLITE
jgi:signal transduction histidine kinase